MTEHAVFDPSEEFVYRGRGSIPRDAVRVEVDRSVKFIPDRLFDSCDRLESVLLHEGLLGIGNHAFGWCFSLRSFRCPSTVTKIGMGAFVWCLNLLEFDLPQGLKSIEGWTFSNCRSLEKVRIPASVARIGACAFRECSNLSSIELCEGLRTIRKRAFHGCRLLRSLCVPLSVDEIGDHAFNDCSSLSSVQLHEDMPRMKLFAFGGCTSLERFGFVRLSERLKAVGMDNQTKSMFEDRLREISVALTRRDVYEEGGYHSDEEEDVEAIWEKCKVSLRRAHKVLTYLELKGAAPLLELAMWKAKIEGEGVQGDLVNDEENSQDLRDAVRERKRPKVTKNTGQGTRLSREDCRVKCGAGMAIPEVLKFFTYNRSWPQLHYSEEEYFDY